jgi:hypothetical protein
LQVLGVLHWSLVAQTLKHCDPLQMYGAQGRDSGATHWPVVLQVDAAVKTPLSQVSLAQTVPLAYVAQLPVPSHLPFVPQVAAPLS